MPTSQASATQRAGRAGRTAPGICYRLYPAAAFDSLPKATPPELTRTDLTTPLLQLKSLGIDDFMRFEWISPPPSESVLRALEGLIRAGMIGQEGALTEVGAKVAECPVEVTIARMVGPVDVQPRDYLIIYLGLSFSVLKNIDAARRFLPLQL